MDAVPADDDDSTLSTTAAVDAKDGAATQHPPAVQRRFLLPRDPEQYRERASSVAPMAAESPLAPACQSGAQLDDGPAFPWLAEEPTVTDLAATVDLCRDPECGTRPRRPSQYTKGRFVGHSLAFCTQPRMRQAILTQVSFLRGSFSWSTLRRPCSSRSDGHTLCTARRGTVEGSLGAASSASSASWYACCSYAEIDLRISKVQLAPPLADRRDLALAPTAPVRNRHRLVLVRSRRDDLPTKVDVVRLLISPRSRAGRLRRDGRWVVLERDGSCRDRRRRLVVGCAWPRSEGRPPHLLGE